MPCMWLNTTKNTSNYSLYLFLFLYFQCRFESSSSDLMSTGNTSGSPVLDSTLTPSTHTTSPPPPSHDQSHDSTDRWAGVCSDEELESKRLEAYKQNRRKRYQNALEEKLSNLAPKTVYYSTGPVS